MNKWIYCIVLCFVHADIFCFESIQPSPLESTESNDSINITNLLRQIDLIKAAQPDSALLLSALALNLSTSVSSPVLSLEVLLNRASIFLSISKTDSADMMIDRADTIWQALSTPGKQYKKLEYELLNVQGSSKQQRRQLSEALTYFLEGKKVAEELEDPVLICKQNYNIGICYLGSGSFLEAIDRLSAVADCARNIDDALLQAKAYNTTGLSYYFIDSLAQAEDQLNSAYELAMQNDLTVLKYQSLANLANVYLDQNQLDKAASKMQSSIAAAAELGDDFAMAANYGNLIRVELRQKKINNAKDHLIKLDEILERSNMPEVAMQAMNFKAILSFFEGDFDKGYQNYSASLSLRDSIRSVETKSRIAELEMEYETVKKDGEIQTQKLAIERKNRQRNQLLLVIALLGVLLIGLYKLFIQSKKRRFIELQLKQQQITELQQKNKILGLASLIEGQEAERSRIAKDLHDGLGVLLSSVRRQVQNVQSEISKLTEIDIIGNTEKLVAIACEEVRRISHDMMPDALINFGLKEAVMDLAGQIQSDHDLIVSVHIEDDLSLSEIQTINLYRIIQEFANNTIKHADASKIAIDINRDNEEIRLSIADDGTGFDLPSVRQKESIGLNNIESRVEFLKGKIIIDTQNGTLFTIVIPL